MTLQAENWTEWVSINVPSRFRKGYLGAYVGNCYSLVADVCEQAMREACLAQCFKEPVSPDDALDKVANQRSLPRYAGETADAHRARLADAWNTWRFAGDESSIEGQLALAGYGNVEVQTDLLSGGHPELGIPNYPASSAYWSQFNVVIKLTSALGSFNDGLERSSIVTAEQLATVRLIIRKFKPVDWICREVIFVLTTPTSHRWDEPGLVWDAPGLVWAASADSLVERFPPLRP